MKKKYLTVLLILLVASTIKAQLAGGLIIKSSHDNVTIKINGVIKGKTPLQVILKPGIYTIIAEKNLSIATRLYYKDSITVTNGKIDDLIVKLKKGLIPNYEAKLEVIISNIKHGTFTDNRDGKTYKTVTIGKQTWMAENLNYNSERWWCYNKSSSNCEKYGRLYRWDEARNVCPSGWYLPSDAEWTTLINNLGGEELAGKKLKSSVDWKLYEDKNYGNNESGFVALPGGYCYSSYRFGLFAKIGMFGYWWSSTPYRSEALYLYLGYSNGEVYLESDSRTTGRSVRCLKD